MNLAILKRQKGNFLNYKMKIESLKKNIQRLTAEEVQELNVDQAMRIIAININNMADIETALFDVAGELGKYRILSDQLKSLKDTCKEQNRALKVIVSNG